MNAAALFLTFVSFVVEHHDELIDLVKKVQLLFAGALPEQKRAQVLGYIQTAMGVADQLEQNPLVRMGFDLLVAKAKGKLAAQTVAVAN